jgi:tRNA pseudouridine38-40 synthase
MRNLKLIIEYDGTNYSGWQRQENSRSIQGEIEAVLHEILRHDCTVNGAGRTDAGVHARGQVGNFKTESAMDAHRIQAALNGLLPKDIVIHSVEEVSPEFHARFGASARSYSYAISRAPSALLRHASWQIRYQLDVDAMQKAAELVRSFSNFRSFAKDDADVPSFECIVKESRWTENGSLLQYDVTADRFLHGMVRALVGSMVDVGRGYTTVEHFSQIPGYTDRTKAGMAAPPHGLVLERVEYGPRKQANQPGSVVHSEKTFP